MLLDQGGIVTVPYEASSYFAKIDSGNATSSQNGCDLVCPRLPEEEGQHGRSVKNNHDPRSTSSRRSLKSSPTTSWGLLSP